MACKISNRRKRQTLSRIRRQVKLAIEGAIAKIIETAWNA